MQFLVEEYGVDVDAIDNTGTTALMAAHTSVVRYRARCCRAGVNAPNIHGTSALMMAAGNGFTDVVRYLVEECGADLEARDYMGTTALVVATANGRRAVAGYLADKQRHFIRADFTSSLATDFNIARVLLAAANRREYGRWGFGQSATPLYAAKQHQGVVRWLSRESGANLTSTTFMVAAARGHLCVVQHL